MKLSKLNGFGLAIAMIAVASFSSQSAMAQETMPVSPAPTTTPTAQETPVVAPTVKETQAPAPVAEPAPASAATPVVAEPAANTIALQNPIDPPQPGKGQVVFFRPSRITGMAVSFSVREGDNGIGKLTNGTYFVHDADLGTKEYNISSETRDTLRLEIEEGETYYVIQTIGMGILMARPNLTPSTATEFQDKKLKVTRATATDRR